jgi:hypothetical protein
MTGLGIVDPTHGAIQWWWTLSLAVTAAMSSLNDDHSIIIGTLGIILGPETSDQPAGKETTQHGYEQQCPNEVGDETGKEKKYSGRHQKGRIQHMSFTGESRSLKSLQSAQALSSNKL